MRTRWSRTRSALRATRLLPLAHRAVYTAQGLVAEAASLREHFRPVRAPDGLPLPPPRLRFLVSGTSDAGYFLESGQRDAEAIRRVLAEGGVPMDSLETLLDFGVGCGRIVRHWRDLGGTAVHGSDFNPALVRWCRRNLPFGSFATNRTTPPLAYADAAFDLAYAFSVFTHLPEELQEAWMAELRRVVRPGGHVLVTTHGESLARAHLAGDELDRFRREGLAVVSHGGAGTNLCNAFHAPGYVRDVLGRGLECVRFAPESAGVQDAYLLRR